MASRLKPDEAAAFGQFVENVLTSGSVQRISTTLNEIEVRPPFKVRIKVVYGETDPFETLLGLPADRDLSLGHASTRSVPAPLPWRLEIPNPNTPGFVLTGGKGRDHVSRFRIPFALLPTDVQDVRLAVAVCRSDMWKVMQRFFRKRYPRIAPVPLSQRELIAGVHAYRDVVSNEYELRVREYSATERGGRKQVRRSVREWTDESLNSVLTQVQERQQTLRSIKVELYRRIGGKSDVTASLSAKVSKSGEVSLTGRFDLARRTVVRYMVDTGGKKLELYRGRGMRERQYKVAPLEISFERPILAEEGEASRLIEAVQTLPNSMHSLQHGNPYVHVRLLDGYDGSSFDIWAVQDDSIVVVPRQKASEAAIERLITHLSDEFAEGMVRDYVDA